MYWWIPAAIGAVSAIASNSSARSAQSQASDANERQFAAQERAAERQLAFQEKQYSDAAPYREWAQNNARRQAEWQGQDRLRYQGLEDEQIKRGRRYQYAEDRMLNEAENFDTEGKRQELAGLARADVEQGFASAEQSGLRSLSRMGVNPGSGRMDALRMGIGLSKAGALAHAGTKARSDAMTLGRAMKMDAIGFGKGLVGNQATQAGLGLNAGNASVTSGNSAANMALNGGNNMANGYQQYGNNMANIGNNRANSFYNANNYGSQVGSSVGNMFGGLGQMGGFSGLRNMWDTWQNPMTIGAPGGMNVGSDVGFQPSRTY